MEMMYCWEEAEPQEVWSMLRHIFPKSDSNSNNFFPTKWLLLPKVTISLKIWSFTINRHVCFAQLHLNIKSTSLLELEAPLLVQGPFIFIYPIQVVLSNFVLKKSLLFTNFVFKSFYSKELGWLRGLAWLLCPIRRYGGQALLAQSQAFIIIIFCCIWYNPKKFITGFAI